MDKTEAILQGFCSLEEQIRRLFGEKEVFTMQTPVDFLDQTGTGKIVLQPNSDRQGIIVSNETSDTIYVSFMEEASKTNHAFKVSAGGTEFYIPAFIAPWKGVISLYAVDPSGTAVITELSYQSL